jgi:hypothetical protein
MAPATAMLSGVVLARLLEATRGIVHTFHGETASRIACACLLFWVFLFCTARPNIVWLRRGVFLTPWQADMMAASDWIRANLPKDRVVGSFSAGVLGYFSDRKVVNLDGVINNSAFHATMEQRLSDYICAQGIRTLADLSLPPRDRIDGPAYGRLLKVRPVYVKESVCQREYTWCRSMVEDFRIVDLDSSACMTGVSGDRRVRMGS